MIDEKGARGLAADIFGISPIRILSDVARPLEKVLTCLNPQERLVLELRYGLKGNRAQTLHEVAPQIGFISRERVRQIQKKAFRRLRYPTRHNILKAYIVGTPAELEADRAERRTQLRKRPAISFLISPRPRPAIKSRQMQDRIKELMKNGMVRDKKAMLESLGLKPRTWGEVAFYQALALLLQMEWIIRVARGIYAAGPQLVTVETQARIKRERDANKQFEAMVIRHA